MYASPPPPRLVREVGMRRSIHPSHARAHTFSLPINNFSLPPAQPTTTDQQLPAGGGGPAERGGHHRHPPRPQGAIRGPYIYVCIDICVCARVCSLWHVSHVCLPVCKGRDDRTHVACLPACKGSSSMCMYDTQDTHKTSRPLAFSPSKTKHQHTYIHTGAPRRAHPRLGARGGRAALAPLYFRPLPPRQGTLR